MTAPQQPQPAVMPDFADATGLDALLAAGGSSAAPAARSHGDAGAVASAPAVPASWPPPPTPEPFKQLAQQLDTISSTLTTLLTGVTVEAEAPEFMNQVADAWWPLAHVYGAGAERPSKGVLWLYAIASLGGLIVVKVARWRKAKSEMPAPDADGGAK